MPNGPWRNPDTFQEGGGRWRGADTFREGGGRWRNPARFVEGGGRWLPENRFKPGPWTWRPGDGDWWKSWQGNGGGGGGGAPAPPPPPGGTVPDNLLGAGARDPQGPGAADRGRWTAGQTPQDVDPILSNQPSLNEFTLRLLLGLLGSNWR